MAKIDDFLPSNDEQLFIVGMKGSGKTTFEKNLIQPLAKKGLVIIVDSKPEWEDTVDFDSRDTTRPHALSPKLWLWQRRKLERKTTKGVYIYQVPAGTIAYGDSFVDTLFLWALKRSKALQDSQNLTLVIDEAADFCHGAYTTPAFDKLLRQSRSKKVRLIIGTQRPKGISTLIVDQARKYAVFLILNKSHRKSLAESIHPALEEPPDGPFSFWWYEVPRDGKPMIKHIRQVS